MLDVSGRVIEATQSNLFLVQDGCLLTPDLTKCGVAGVVRGLILELASELQIATTVSETSLDQVKAADALFLTNSLLGICPVARLDECRYDIHKIPSILIRSARDLAVGSTRAD
jgi:4-amino-4-deoxychorismate lyase